MKKLEIMDGKREISDLGLGHIKFENPTDMQGRWWGARVLGGQGEVKAGETV